MAVVSDEMLDLLVQSADHSHVRLQMTAGVPTWEAMPGWRHQRIILDVRDSVRRPSGEEGDCGCHAGVDVMVRFPEGSFRSPDVAIFCQLPPDRDGAVDILPAAVIEVVSAGYEERDRIGLPFYLAQGIADVVVYDPPTGEVVHATAGGKTVHAAPVDLTFACGCAVTIPR